DLHRNLPSLLHCSRWFRYPVTDADRSTAAHAKTVMGSSGRTGASRFWVSASGLQAGERQDDVSHRGDAERQADELLQLTVASESHTLGNFGRTFSTLD